MAAGTEDAGTDGDQYRLAREVGDAEAVRAVFDQMPAILLGMAGPQQEVIAANATFRALTGRNAVGKSISELFPEAAGQLVFPIYDRVFRTGEPQVAREWRFQLDLTGTGELCDSYFDFVLAARRDADGRIVGTNLVCADVTDRVRERQAAEERAAVAERRYAQARDVITALQRELLPPGLPVLPGLRMSAGYLPAEVESAAGGDWFDAIALPGGQVALVVGDVVGHGVAASATMGQLRAVLQDRLAAAADGSRDAGAGEADAAALIAAALAGVDRLAHRLPGARAATVCLAVLDPGDGRVTYCTAGHPPPLLVTASGEGRYLTATGAGPLGGDGVFPVDTQQVAEGEVLVLFSDGIVERPGRAHADSLVELSQVAGDAARDRIRRGSGLSAVERVCTQAVELLVRSTGHADDVTLLAAQRVPVPEPLRLELPAREESITRLHRAAAGWLDGLGVDAAEVSALRHAVCELVTNAVAHAYRGAARWGPVRVAGDLTADGTVLIEVTDEGRWLDRPAGERGRSGGLGLVLTEHFVDALHVDRRPGGTTVTLRRAVSTPARLLTLDQRTRPAPVDEPELLLILDQPGAPASRVRVDGPLTAVTAPHLAKELQRLTRNGTRGLTVDLTGVTLLVSGAVAVLQHALRRSDAHGSELLLFAPPGGTAQHVLALTALPHRTEDPHAPDPVG